MQVLFPIFLNINIIYDAFSSCTIVCFRNNNYLASSSSSALFAPSFSYLDLHCWASPLAFDSRRWSSAFPSCSSSNDSLTPSMSAFKFLMSLCSFWRVYKQTRYTRYEQYYIVRIRAVKVIKLFLWFAHFEMFGIKLFKFKVNYIIFVITSQIQTLNI